MKRYQVWLYRLMIVILGTIVSSAALAKDQPVGKARVVSSVEEQVAPQKSASVQRQQVLDRVPMRDPFQPPASVYTPQFDVCFTGNGAELATEAFLDHAREIGQPVRVMARSCALEVVMAVGRDYVSATFIAHTVDGDQIVWKKSQPIGAKLGTEKAISCLIPSLMVELQEVVLNGVCRKERPKTKVAISVNLGSQSYGRSYGSHGRGGQGYGGYGSGLGVSVSNDRYRVSVSTGFSGRGGQSSWTGGPRYTSSFGSGYGRSSGRGGGSGYRTSSGRGGGQFSGAGGPRYTKSF